MAEEAAIVAAATPNGLVTKLIFVLAVVIVLTMIASFGLQVLSFFIDRTQDPYVMYGRVSGTSNLMIPQDPKNPAGHPILRSSNAKTGVEYTWCVWILNAAAQVNAPAGGLQTIFRKGSHQSVLLDATSLLIPSADAQKLVNGPGVYLDAATSHLVVMLDVLNQPETQVIETASSIPVNKWLHIAIRVKNTICDVYINGTVVKRADLPHIPFQNYENVVIGQGMLDGLISNLAYYPSALSVYELNRIVSDGPTLDEPKHGITSATKSLGWYQHLSTAWYQSNR
jgi:hypothetical protein